MKTTRCLFTPLLFFLFLLFPFSNSVQSETTECTVISSLPYVISTQGNYCLKGHLATGMTSGNAITINTNNVVIDLNGYKLGGLGAGHSTTADGIYAYQRQNITIRNGTVRGFYKGIYIEDTGSYSTSQAHLVEDIRADMNTAVGIDVRGRGNMIRNNQVVDTGESIPADTALGISIMGPGNRVINNDVYETVAGGSHAAFGIYFFTADGGVVEKNRIGNATLPSSGTSNGINIYSSNNVLITNNRITTMDSGIYYQPGSTSGKYRDNLTSGVTTRFTGGAGVIDLGGND
jgi:nitrous oxidase accessory protein NosD